LSFSTEKAANSLQKLQTSLSTKFDCGNCTNLKWPAALQDCSGAGNSKTEKYGSHRAEGRRDWCSRDCADHFRPHDCAAQFRRCFAKTDKWQQIAIEAAKQCGQNWLPRVHAPKKLAEFFSASERAFDLRLIGSLQPDAQQLKKILETYSSEHVDRPRNVLMLVGRKATSHQLSLRWRGVTAASQLHSAQSSCEWRRRRFTA